MPMKQTVTKENVNIYTKVNICNFQSLSDKNKRKKEINNIKHCPEKALWKAVIMQSVLDTMNTSARTEHKMAKYDALNWLNVKNPYFLWVCENADLNPAWVLNKIKIALQNPRIWRRPCDLKKFMLLNKNI